MRIIGHKMLIPQRSAISYLSVLSAREEVSQEKLARKK